MKSIAVMKKLIIANNWSKKLHTLEQNWHKGAFL